MDDSPPRFLLLLPPVPSTPRLSSLRESFGDTISQVLKEVASHSSGSASAAVLEVALACPELVDQQRAPRSTLFGSVQAALAAVYKLICVIAAKDRVNIEDKDGVDVRIIPIAWSSKNNAEGSGLTGPVATLAGVAQSHRQWQYAFSVESDAGEAMVKTFVAAKGNIEPTSTSQSPSSATVDALRGQTQPDIGDHQDHEDNRKHYHVAVGGTFDHLHIGHKLLLTITAFAVDTRDSGDRTATIGITGDQLLVNKKHAQFLESWKDRQRAVQDFLDSILNFTSESPRTTTRNGPGPNGIGIDVHYPDLLVKCTEIQDPFGPTITEERISALIISAETRSGGQAVNDKRKEKGWSELEVFEVEVLDAEDENAEVKEGFGNKLSSTAIRERLLKRSTSGADPAKSKV